MLCRICVEITASKHADMYHRRENHGRFGLLISSSYSFSRVE